VEFRSGVSAYSAAVKRGISSRAVLLLLAGVLALAAGVYFGRGADFGVGGGKPDAQALLGLSLPDIQGQEQALAQWKGKVLIVNFWATWCVPCREEMPEFVSLQREYGARGVQFVGIAADDEVAPGLGTGETPVALEQSVEGIPVAVLEPGNELVVVQIGERVAFTSICHLRPLRVV